MKMSDACVADDQPHEVKFKCNVKFIAEAVKNAEKSTHLQFDLVSNQMPMIIRFGGGEFIQKNPVWAVNGNINAEESFTMLVAKIAEK